MKILKIKDKNRLDEISKWFSDRWEVPTEAYRQSILESLEVEKVPSWYMVVEDDHIIGGAGVIENDFHEREDLTPNICALYVDEAYRKKNIARDLLRFIVNDYNSMGVERLYLVTDHDRFYERCNWEFIGFVKNDEGTMDRMYSNKS